MSWQNWVFSWILRKKFKKLAKNLSLSANDMRTHSAKLSKSMRPPKAWRVREVNIHPQNLKGEWIEPVDRNRREATSRVVLYLHGGGYCFCSAATHRSIASALAVGADARAFLPDYRLAPEHRFPAAIDDAFTAYLYLLAEGVQSGRIVICGDSSGGGMALSTLFKLRDADLPLPAGAVLFSPWTDLASTGASLRTNEESDVMLTKTALEKFSQYYLDSSAADHHLASPLYGDFTGVPPLFIQASDTEILLDDAARVAEKARLTGVEVNFKIWSGLPHAWPTMTPFLPEAKAALKDATDFIRRATQ
ncbi:alpha/beta hydrolase [Rhizobium skierniewicense]|uniref:alpha/beta hydrolase n=1 Tax=Rhizobium skierniewicense TaxID=984260 RepID=UPI001572ECAC|nr:alpha/beta hydrolase [Rhizobium skierniewicense]NTF35007.1 alpha/beta hydrolase [Rhizobium skierniewicense]